MTLGEFAASVYRIESEKRRLEALRYLSGQPKYEASAGLIKLRCQHIGVPSTSDQIQTALQWLEEQDLVTLRHHDEATVARITVSGRDVAEGNRIIPGVLRPDP